MCVEFQRIIEEDWVVHDYFVFSKTAEIFASIYNDSLFKCPKCNEFSSFEEKLKNCAGEDCKNNKSVILMCYILEKTLPNIPQNKKQMDDIIKLNSLVKNIINMHKNIDIWIENLEKDEESQIIQVSNNEEHNKAIYLTLIEVDN